MAERYTEEEREFARKYSRITGVQPLVVIDQLRIFTSPDLLPALERYIERIKRDGIQLSESDEVIDGSQS